MTQAKEDQAKAGQAEVREREDREREDEREDRERGLTKQERADLKEQDKERDRIQRQIDKATDDIADARVVMNQAYDADAKAKREAFLNDPFVRAQQESQQKRLQDEDAESKAKAEKRG
jgi:hypothetical protein